MRTRELSTPLWEFFLGSVSAHSLARPTTPTWSRGAVLSGRECGDFPGRVVSSWIGVPGRVPRGSQSVSEERILSPEPANSWVRVCFDPTGPDGVLGDWFILAGCSAEDAWVSRRSSTFSPEKTGRLPYGFRLEGRPSASPWWPKLSSVDACAASSGGFGRWLEYDGSVEVVLRCPG